MAELIFETLGTKGGSVFDNITSGPARHTSPIHHITPTESKYQTIQFRTGYQFVREYLALGLRKVDLTHTYFAHRDKPEVILACQPNICSYPKRSVNKING